MGVKGRVTVLAIGLLHVCEFSDELPIIACGISCLFTQIGVDIFIVASSFSMFSMSCRRSYFEPGSLNMVCRVQIVGHLQFSAL